MEGVISILLIFIVVYLAIGNWFAIIFLWKGVSKVDPAMKGSGIIMKLLLLPGLAIFWPVFLMKWKSLK